jgi:hypothetical protein
MDANERECFLDFAGSGKKQKSASRGAAARLTRPSAKRTGRREADQ